MQDLYTGVFCISSLLKNIISTIPTDKPTFEEAFPVLEANIDANDNPKKIVATMPSKKRLTPLSILVCDTISAIWSCTILKVLFDPGLTVTLISRKCLPRHCKPCPVTKSRSVNTLAGSCTANEMVVLQAIQLPELNKKESSISTRHLCLSATLVTILY